MNPDNIPLRRHPLPHVETYDVTAQELTSIENESFNVGQDLQFGTSALSIAATLLVALLLTDIPSPKRYACFFAATLTTAALAVYFFIQHLRKRGNFRSTIQTIRDRQIGPVGEEGHEIRPGDLAALTVTPPPPALTETPQATEPTDTPQMAAPATSAPPEPAPAAGEQK